MSTVFACPDMERMEPHRVGWLHLSLKTRNTSRAWDLKPACSWRVRQTERPGGGEHVDQLVLISFGDGRHPRFLPPVHNQPILSGDLAADVGELDEQHPPVGWVRRPADVTPPSFCTRRPHPGRVGVETEDRIEPKICGAPTQRDRIVETVDPRGDGRAMAIRFDS
jgi:hypothetical protein